MSAKHETLNDVNPKPIITEKATMALPSHNAVRFRKSRIDSKQRPMIKEAVEALFGVKVKGREPSYHQRPRQKRFRGQMGPPEGRPKKAYVNARRG